MKRGPGLRTSEVKDDPRLPAPCHLCDGDLMVGNRFDFSINGVAVRVQGLPSHRSCQVCRLQRHQSKGAAEQALRIVQVEQLTEPAHEQILYVSGADAERDALLWSNRRGIAHQVEHGPGGMGK